jgi:hypothetical protein
MNHLQHLKTDLDGLKEELVMWDELVDALNARATALDSVCLSLNEAQDQGKRVEFTAGRVVSSVSKVNEERVLVTQSVEQARSVLNNLVVAEEKLLNARQEELQAHGETAKLQNALCKMDSVHKLTVSQSVCALVTNANNEDSTVQQHLVRNTEKLEAVCRIWEGDEFLC